MKWKWELGSLKAEVRRQIRWVKFRWRVGRGYRWPLRRVLAWVLFDDGRYIKTGIRFREDDN